MSFCFLVFLREKKGRPVLCECDIDITRSFREATKDWNVSWLSLLFVYVAKTTKRDYKKRNEKPAAT